MRWSTACPDWERRIVAGESLVPLTPLFPDEAAAALAVFKSLKIVDADFVVDEASGAARPPTFGEVAEPFVFDFVSAIFGAYDASQGRRLIREFLLLISKKNGKSTLAAGIMVTALVRNWRHHAELLILAPTLEVANNCYDPAAAMVRYDPQLTDLLHVRDHKREIRHRLNGAVLKVVAADSDTVSGSKAGFVLIEELWAFGKKPRAGAMLTEATGGLVARPEGFVVALSTQSDEPPVGVWERKLKFFREVRDGKVVDPQSLGVLYEFPPEMIEAEAYLDPKNFYITNPNLGKSVDHAFIVDRIEKARRGEGEDTLQGVLAKFLNVEIGLRLHAARWRGADYWLAAAEPALKELDAIVARSEVLVAGIDGGGLDDLLGLAVLGRERESGRWLGWCHAWCDAGVLDLRKAAASTLRDCEAAGELTIVEDLPEDIEELVGILAMLDATGLLAGVGCDPFGVAALVDALHAAKIGGPEDAAGNESRVQAVSQGYKLNGAILGLERKVRDGTFRHGGQGLMSWCVGNAKVERKGNAVVVTKAASGAGKIDPLMALFDAVTLMSANPQAPAHAALALNAALARRGMATV